MHLSFSNGRVRSRSRLSGSSHCLKGICGFSPLFLNATGPRPSPTEFCLVCRQRETVANSTAKRGRQAGGGDGCGVLPFLVRLLPADAWRHTQKCKRLDLSTTRALGWARIGLGLYVARDDKCEPLALRGRMGRSIGSSCEKVAPAFCRQSHLEA